MIAPYLIIIINKQDLVVNNSFLSELLSIIKIRFEYPFVIFDLGLLLLLIFLIKGIVHITIHYKVNKFWANQNKILKVKLMTIYQNLKYENYINRNSSSYIQAINHHTTKFSSVLNQMLVMTSDLISVIAIVLFLSIENIYPMLIFTVTFGSIIFIIDYFTKRYLDEYSKKIINSNTIIIKTISEGIRGLKEIKVLGVEKYFIKILENSASTLSINQYKTKTVSSINRPIFEFLLILFVIILTRFLFFIYGSFYELIPILGAFGLASLRLFPAFSSLSLGMNTIRSSRPEIDSIYIKIYN